MFLALLRKECMQYLKSVIYYIFIIYLILDFVVQMGVFDPVRQPEPGMEDYSQYGSVKAENPELVMQAALDELLAEYDRGEYTTYPIGFYKKFIPDEAERKEIRDILLNMTGLTEEELVKAYEDYANDVEMVISEAEEAGELAIPGKDIPVMHINVSEGYTEEVFYKDMERLDTLLGGGSSYSETNLERGAEQSPTYEQACKVYDDFIYRDKVTGAYARLFCDYEGITLAIITVFLAVTRGLRDRRAQAEQVIYAHRISSFRLILSRYLAGVIMAVIPVFALSCSTMAQSVYYARHLGVECDYLAFVRYIGFWLMPTILVTLSLGFFLTEFTDSAIAILVQVVWWFVSLNSAPSLISCSRFNLIPRFNDVVGYEIYEEMRPVILWNRCFFTILAVVLLLLTVWVYDMKRKGVFVSVGTRIRNRKNKLEA